MSSVRNPNRFNELLTKLNETSPNIGILRDLADKLLSEIDYLSKEFNNKETPERLYLGVGFNLDEQVHKFEVNMIRYALQITNQNQRKAAKMLGVKITTLNAKIKRFGIPTKPSFDNGMKW